MESWRLAIFGNRYERFLANSGFGIFTDLRCVRLRQFSRSVNVGIVRDTTFGTLSPTCVLWSVISLSTGRNLDYAAVRFSPVQPFFLFLKVNPQFNFLGGTIWKLQKSRLQGQTAQDSLQT